MSSILTDTNDVQLAFVAPDTSPRGANIAGEDDGWDFGTGAGFYLDATAEPWSNNYRMYSYITEELPALLAEHFPSLDQGRVGILGHSMGGHGALTIAFKNQTKYKYADSRITELSAIVTHICEPVFVGAFPPSRRFRILLLAHGV